MKRFLLRPKFSLRTVLILFTLICLLCSRFVYLHNWVQARQSFCIDVSYTWENPRVVKSGRTLVDGARGFQQKVIENTIEKSYSKKTWFHGFRSFVTGDKIEALQIPTGAVNDRSIAMLQKMTRLKHVIVLGAGKYPPAPSRGPLLTLENAIPHVDVHPSRVFGSPTKIEEHRPGSEFLINSNVSSAFEGGLEFSIDSVFKQ